MPLIAFLPSIAEAQFPDRRFGAVDAFFDSARADELGAAWSRVIFPWQRVQRAGPHEWWPAIDPAYIDEEVRRGREVVGILVNTPEWASAIPGRAWNVPPKGLDRSITDPENLWATFVRRSASAYRGKVDTWIVWNEPDVSDPHHPGYTWAGSVEEFYQLQKVAYRAARLGNPNAKVLLPGLTYWWDKRYERPQFFERLLEVASRDPEAPANGWFFDAAVLQLYNEPRLLYDVPKLYRETMARYGIDKPIWINETNVAPWDDWERPLTREHRRANAKEQAGYVIQGYALALAAGVERIEIYKLKDESEWRYGWESYGTIGYDRAQRPEFYALQMIHRLYAGVTSGVLDVREGVTAVTLTKPTERIIVLWASGPRPATVDVTAASPAAVAYHWDTSARHLTPAGGAYRIVLDAATHNAEPGRPDVYLSGGAPVIVVEPGVGPPARLTVTLGPRSDAVLHPSGPLQSAVDSLRAVNAAAR